MRHHGGALPLLGSAPKERKAGNGWRASEAKRRAPIARVWPLCIGIITLAGLIVAQPAVDERQRAQLERLFPDATSFSSKGGSPPHYRAFVTDPKTGAQRLAGVGFWTTEIDPLERGYDGPIKILVGLTPNGTLAGILVVDHHEPYGYFSVDLPEFAAQFKGKPLTDPFRVGQDIDAVSRATLTVSSATRAVRNSARRVATRLFKP